MLRTERGTMCMYLIEDNGAQGIHLNLDYKKTPECYDEIWKVSIMFSQSSLNKNK